MFASFGFDFIMINTPFRPQKFKPKYRNKSLVRRRELRQFAGNHGGPTDRHAASKNRESNAGYNYEPDDLFL